MWARIGARVLATAARLTDRFDRRPCDLCGRVRPRNELVRVGDVLVCPEHHAEDHDDTYVVEPDR